MTKRMMRSVMGEIKTILHIRYIVLFRINANLKSINILTLYLNVIITHRQTTEYSKTDADINDEGNSCYELSCLKNSHWCMVFYHQCHIPSIFWQEALVSEVRKYYTNLCHCTVGRWCLEQYLASESHGNLDSPELLWNLLDLLKHKHSPA